MKKLALLVCTLVSLYLPAQLLVAQAKSVLPINRQASSIKWTGHAEVGTYAPVGSLAVKDGQVVIQNGTFSAATLIIDMTSLNQDNQDLTHHLKSADFFDVEKYPTATLAIDKVANGIVSGTLTIKGKPTPFESPVKVTTAGDQFTITGKVRLDRTKYGIFYNSNSFFSGLGDKAIRNTFEVEFAIAGNGKLPEKYRS